MWKGLSIALVFLPRDSFTFVIRSPHLKHSSFLDATRENPEMEYARTRLEAIFLLPSENSNYGGTDTSYSSTVEDVSSNSLDDVPQGQLKMSGTRRRRIEREKYLVESLADPQDETQVIDALWGHWFGERGLGPRMALDEVEQLVDFHSPVPARLDLAAQRLNELIEQQPGWTEPMNRLAMVRFLQGRIEESEVLCNQVLNVKPWHFGARNGLVMCHKSQGRLACAQRENLRGLPPLGCFRDRDGNLVEPRKEWVKTMVQEIEMRRKFLM